MLRYSDIGHGRGLALPGPLALDLEHERPAQEGAHQHQAGQQRETLKIQFKCDRLDDIGRDQHLEPEQQRAADADLVDVVAVLRRQTAQIAHRRPHDPDHDDEDAEHLDAVADHPDPVADRGLEHGLGSVPCMAGCPYAGARPCSEFRRAGTPWISMSYFVTLDVIDLTTDDAILNCASRSLMPWRRAIQAKSV